MCNRLPPHEIPVLPHFAWFYIEAADISAEAGVPQQIHGGTTTELMRGYPGLLAASTQSAEEPKFLTVSCGPGT
jgi:hypothetical protein